MSHPDSSPFRRQLLASVGWLTLALVTASFAGVAHAKRVGPKAVPPVIKAGVRYEAPHFLVKDGTPENGGHVQAFDQKTGKMLWERRIYRIMINADLERDVQDVFITELRVRGAKLLVRNERKERFELDLASGRVRAVGKLDPRTVVVDGVAPTK